MAFDRDKIKQVAAELAANGIFIGTWTIERLIDEATKNQEVFP